MPSAAEKGDVMISFQMEELMQKVGSRYKLTILASRRTLELNEGKEKLVDTPPNTKLASIAIKEIEEGKISYKSKEA